MKNIRIYQPGQFETGQSYQLDKAASNHLLKVLRLKHQQLFTLFNGEGGEFTASLEVSGKTAIAHIQTYSDINNTSALKIHLLQGISKGDRMDFAIQKSVELGVSKITPVVCERTVVNLKGERQDKKLQHWCSIATSACEQSGLNILPQIENISNLSQLIQSDTSNFKLLLDPLSATSFHTVKPTGNNVVILIGPEGGLSESEINLATQHGFTGVRLGPRILRTETAALTAISAAQLLWGDLK